MGIFGPKLLTYKHNSGDILTIRCKMFVCGFILEKKIESLIFLLGIPFKITIQH